MNDRLYDDIEKDLDSIVSPSSEMVPSWQAHLHQTVESDPYKLLTAVSCVEMIVNIIVIVVVIIFNSSSTQAPHGGLLRRNKFQHHRRFYDHHYLCCRHRYCHHC